MNFEVDEDSAVEGIVEKIAEFGDGDEVGGDVLAVHAATVGDFGGIFGEEEVRHFVGHSR